MNLANLTKVNPKEELLYEMDKTYLTAYLIFLATLAILFNGMSIYLTQRYDQLRVPHMYIRIIYAMFDIIFALLMIIHYIIVFQLPNVPILIKCLTGDFCMAQFFGTTQLTAFIALERYCYFCKPMVYNQVFTFRSISLISLFIFTITQGYFIITEFVYERKMQPLIGICISTYPIHNMSNLFIFVLPAVVITLFSIYKIMRLLRIININPNTSTNITHSEPMLRRRAAKNGLR